MLHELRRGAWKRYSAHGAARYLFLHVFVCLIIYFKRYFYLAFPFGEGGTLGVTDEGREGAANAAEAVLANKSFLLNSHPAPSAPSCLALTRPQASTLP